MRTIENNGCFINLHNDRIYHDLSCAKSAPSAAVLGMLADFGKWGGLVYDHTDECHSERTTEYDLTSDDALSCIEEISSSDELQNDKIWMDFPPIKEGTTRKHLDNMNNNHERSSTAAHPETGGSVWGDISTRVSHRNSLSSRVSSSADCGRGSLCATTLRAQRERSTVYQCQGRMWRKTVDHSQPSRATLAMLKEDEASQTPCMSTLNMQKSAAVSVLNVLRARSGKPSFSGLRGSNVEVSQANKKESFFCDLTGETAAGDSPSHFATRAAVIPEDPFEMCADLYFGDEGAFDFSLSA